MGFYLQSHSLLLESSPAIMPVMFLPILRSMRPKQWAKNVFIFAALVFDRQLFGPEALLRTLAGFGLLCLISSAVYLLNDIADLEADQQHPTKRFRPIASGQLPVSMARWLTLAMAVIALTLGFQLGTAFAGILATYFVLNLLYSFWLKHVPVLDVLVVSSGFVLRVGAGVSLITVERFSPWLYVCTTLLALLISFGKRRAEILLLAEGANSHRKVLDGYTLPLLDQFVVIVSSTAVIAYSLYTFSATNLPDNHLMMLTIPLVIYGIFRYLYLIQVEGAGGAPEEIFIQDRPLQATVVLWGLVAVLVLYLGP
jgi:4-hydroxybenzoate polyprenyltransferase